MAFTHYTLIEFIQDQLWSYQDANKLRETIRDFAEDILGDPSTAGDKIGDVRMGHGSNHGGRIYFGGTTNYIGYNTSDEFEHGGCDLRVEANYMINWEKILVSWQIAMGSGVDTYVTTDSNSAVLGYVMPRAGYVVSTCIAIDDFGAGIIGSVTATIYKNGSSFLQIGNWASPSGKDVNSDIQADITTYQFAAGDYLELFIDLGGLGSTTYSIFAAMEAWVGV